MTYLVRGCGSREATITNQQCAVRCYFIGNGGPTAWLRRTVACSITSPLQRVSCGSIYLVCFNITSPIHSLASHVIYSKPSRLLSTPIADILLQQLLALNMAEHGGHVSPGESRRHVSLAGHCGGG